MPVPGTAEEFEAARGPELELSWKFWPRQLNFLAVPGAGLPEEFEAVRGPELELSWKFRPRQPNLLRLSREVSTLVHRVRARPHTPGLCPKSDFPLNPLTFQEPSFRPGNRSYACLGEDLNHRRVQVPGEGQDLVAVGRPEHPGRLAQAPPMISICQVDAGRNPPGHGGGLPTAPSPSFSLPQSPVTGDLDRGRWHDHRLEVLRGQSEERTLRRQTRRGISYQPRAFQRGQQSRPRPCPAWHAPWRPSTGSCHSNGPERRAGRLRVQ